MRDTFVFPQALIRQSYLKIAHRTPQEYTAMGILNATTAENLLCALSFLNSLRVQTHRPKKLSSFIDSNEVRKSSPYIANCGDDDLLQSWLGILGSFKSLIFHKLMLINTLSFNDFSRGYEKRDSNRDIYMLQSRGVCHSGLSATINKPIILPQARIWTLFTLTMHETNEFARGYMIRTAFPVKVGAAPARKRRRGG